MPDDWDYVTRFRDAIVDIAQSVVDRARPTPRYATVISVDRINRKCMVRFPGESADVSIPMGSTQPAQIGQTVRVSGNLGDRYVDDVMGQAVVAGGTPIGAIIEWPSGVATPSGYLTANGAYLDPASYPSLFAIYAFTQGQQGTLFRIPTRSGGIIRAA